jgi:hypothetical protein
MEQILQMIFLATRLHPDDERASFFPFKVAALEGISFPLPFLRLYLYRDLW